MSNDPKLDELVRKCREAERTLRAACARTETIAAELAMANKATSGAWSAVQHARNTILDYISDSVPDAVPVDGGGT